MLWMIVVLMVLGLLFLFLEVFLPGGVTGIIGSVMLLVGVILSFVHFDEVQAFSILVGTVLISVMIMVLGVKIFPRTRLAGRIILREGLTRDRGYTPSSEEHESLVGLSGVAISTLRPSGIADFDGRRVDVVTEGDFIREGERVVVVGADGNRVVVERQNSVG
ncbi:MAG TPA: NfeD family protein [bacterium]|nr:NfeD family protein [bacterium]